MIFYNRQESGRSLVPHLSAYKGQKDTIVLGLARGGMVVAYEVAKGLSLPLNVLVPRKIGAPGNPELAIGAITEDGEKVLDERISGWLGVSQAYISHAIEKEKAHIQKKLSLYRKDTPLPDLKDHCVILVDDGIATGSTMLVTIKSMRHAKVSKIVVAVPVSSPEALNIIENKVDEVVCLYSPPGFGAVGYFYQHFDQTEDSEVIELLTHLTQKEWHLD